MAASNTPMPPGAWLAKPSSVAETKITASVTKPILGSPGTSMYIASAQKPRSTIPMPICSNVSGPPGKFAPCVAADNARAPPDPADVERQHDQDHERSATIEPGRQLIDSGGGERR